MRTIGIYDPALASDAAHAVTAMHGVHRFLASLALLALGAPLAHAQGVVNIYSARR